MNCPNCGTSNLDNASICINCGKQLNAPTAQSYTPPPPPSAQATYIPPPPRASMGGGESIPNYLVQSILVTLCCCLPLGVVAIVFAAQVNSKLASGDLHGAREASQRAKLFCWIAFGLGLAMCLIWMVTGGAAFVQGIREGMANR